MAELAFKFDNRHTTLFNQGIVREDFESSLYETIVR